MAKVLQLHGEWSQHVTLDERFLGLATTACAKGRQWQRALQLAMETGGVAGRAGDVWEDGKKNWGKNGFHMLNFSVSEEISLLHSLGLLQVKGQWPIFPSHFECGQKSSVHHHFDCGLQPWSYWKIVCLRFDWLFPKPTSLGSWKWGNCELTNPSLNQLEISFGFGDSTVQNSTWPLGCFRISYVLIPVSLFVLCKVRW